MECIQANLELMKFIYPKLCQFFSNYLLPELLTNSNWLAYPHDAHSQDDETDDVFIAFAESLHMAQWSLVIHQNAQMNGFTFSVLDWM